MLKINYNKVKDHYKNGDLVGSNGIVFIEETNPIIYKDSSILRTANFKCSCGKIFNTVIARVKNNRSKSCGCLKLSIFLNNVYIHGLAKHPSYHIWKSIKERIFNQNAIGFKNYGGRGITIFPPWIHDFSLFYDYVSSLPHFGEKGYSIDRINNDGNYEPGNLRWTTRHVQNINKRTYNSTGHHGVYHASKDSWSFSVGEYKRNGFCSLEDAIKARDRYILNNKLIEYPLNISKLKEG